MAANRYKAGTAIKMTTTVKNTSGALTNGDSASITVTDPNGTVKVTSASMTNDSTGVYSYIIQTATNWTTGIYQVQINVVSGVYTSINNDIDTFELF